MALLEVRGLVKIYGRRKVVNGVSFEVNAGEVVGLLGPNGAGKTTSFRMTTGMVTPNAGRVFFNGKDVTHWPMYRRARLGMGYLSQESSIFRRLTVEENILAILEAMPASRSLGRRLTAKERRERTDQALEEFGLTRVRKSIASLLSGGEKRRLEIARCLVCEPLLILLDEPFTGIDPITINEIQGIVRRLRANGIGLLLTDHNVREALKITDRSYVITDGVVEAHGTPEEIVRNPLVIARYLGREFAEETLARQASLSFTPSRSEMLTHLAVSAATPQSLSEPERLRALIEQLAESHREQAMRELEACGVSAVPILVEALERRNVEVRRAAYEVLRRVVPGVAPFDPYAPEAQRLVQIAQIREGWLRRAG
ncbi:MAG: LPS export ABC transporter ATP-binding protein [Gemmatales bacterium]|nr:LPS export ABC transporter ATP-binding protein [Gemmatales bacterium]MDW8385703.1 LPS export ABC transporter ATP-binding protein [Gemmatales bacterium]